MLYEYIERKQTHKIIEWIIQYKELQKHKNVRIYEQNKYKSVRAALPER